MQEGRVTLRASGWGAVTNCSITGRWFRAKLSPTLLIKCRSWKKPLVLDCCYDEGLHPCLYLCTQRPPALSPRSLGSCLSGCWNGVPYLKILCWVADVCLGCNDVMAGLLCLLAVCYQDESRACCCCYCLRNCLSILPWRQLLLACACALRPAS